MTAVTNKPIGFAFMARLKALKAMTAFLILPVSNAFAVASKWVPAVCAAVRSVSSFWLTAFLSRADLSLVSHRVASFTATT